MKDKPAAKRSPIKTLAILFLKCLQTKGIVRSGVMNSK